MFNFFHKNKSTSEKTLLKQGLAKSKEKLNAGLARLLVGKKQIDKSLLNDLETLLISADIGIQTTNKVLESVRRDASHQDLKNADSLYQLLKQALADLLPEDKPITTDIGQTFVILVVGVNGAGKTTTIGKLAKAFQNQGKSVMLAAGDTFRAGAIEQLKTWGERNKIPVIAQNTGADAASVVFAAYQLATAKNTDILIADTAGRLSTQDNLMRELEKISRVLKKHNAAAPHETMLIIDGSSGQNAVNQALKFNQVVGLSGISITKLDGTAKGGVLFAIADTLKLPIRYIGIGEGINDLKPFVSKDFVAALFD